MIKYIAMKRAILSNITFSFLIKILTYGFSFFTLMYVARILQPDTFGKTSFSASFAGYFVMFASLGMPIYAMRACAAKRSDRRELSKIFNELWSINIFLSVISALGLFIAIIFIGKLRTNLGLIAIYGSSILFQMIGCEWLFKGLEKFKLLAIVSFIFKIISFVLILIFVQSETDVLIYALLSVLSSYGSSIVYFIILHRYVDVRFSYKINWKHLRSLLIFFMMTCAVTIYSSLDLTMLGFMKTDAETGLYSIASKGKEVLTLLGGLVWSSVLPIATRLWKDGDRARFKSLAVKSLVIVSGIQMVLA